LSGNPSFHFRPWKLFPATILRRAVLTGAHGFSKEKLFTIQKKFPHKEKVRSGFEAASKLNSHKKVAIRNYPLKTGTRLTITGSDRSCISD